MDKSQVYIAISLPGQSRIVSYGQDEDVYSALMTAMRKTFKELEMRDSDCSISKNHQTESEE